MYCLQCVVFITAQNAAKEHQLTQKMEYAMILPYWDMDIRLIWKSVKERMGDFNV